MPAQTKEPDILSEIEETVEEETDIDMDRYPPEKRIALAVELREAVSYTALSALMRRLSAKNQRRFFAISETGKREELYAFLHSEVPDHALVIQNAVRDEVRRILESQESVMSAR